MVCQRNLQIDKVLSMIRKVWKAYPDLRLMQLLGNAHGLRSDPYYVDDDQLQFDLACAYPAAVSGLGDFNKNSRTRKSVRKTSKKKP